MITLDTFLECLDQSALLTPDQFALASDEVRSQPGINAVKAAAWLVERRYITKWQAEQLLTGITNFTLGKYKLVDLIGQGGMGFVFKAEHAVMGRTVAVKVLSRARLNNPTAVARFRREVKAVAKLDHPNIITAHDAGHVGDMHYLVMEYVEGQDLNAMLKQMGQVPVEWAAEFVRQAALGLAHAHKQRLIHRDLKPANLLVTWNDLSEPPVVKILDLGLARFNTDLSDEDGAPLDDVDLNDSIDEGVTQFGHIVGTPDYLSPEQIRGENVDIRSDIFSLGCTLFKLLTAQIPFGGKNVVAKLQARINENAPPAVSVRTLRPDVPVELDQIVASMLERDPDRRPQTPGEVAIALLPFSLTQFHGAASASGTHSSSSIHSSSSVHSSSSIHESQPSGSSTFRGGHTVGPGRASVLPELLPPVAATQFHEPDPDSKTQDFLRKLSTDGATPEPAIPNGPWPPDASTVRPSGQAGISTESDFSSSQMTDSSFSRRRTWLHAYLPDWLAEMITTPLGVIYTIVLIVLLLLTFYILARNFLEQISRADVQAEGAAIQQTTADAS